MLLLLLLLLSLVILCVPNIISDPQISMGPDIRWSGCSGLGRGLLAAMPCVAEPASLRGKAKVSASAASLITSHSQSLSHTLSPLARPPTASKVRFLAPGGRVYFG
ncbi:hypothetical protein LX32DRAFT_656879 [Colletotrichum zoysiae]|uniref:Secreted protein n=1 Tax=Colletotrichum zoysiae TaxID=1216348 RepID=A0AAD9H857_9PEZI|nr:hypothetical protein LX32DRAFT_656879 [Colletotrichum zoysiae]